MRRTSGEHIKTENRVLRGNRKEKGVYSGASDKAVSKRFPSGFVEFHICRDRAFSRSHLWRPQMSFRDLRAFTYSYTTVERLRALLRCLIDIYC